MPIKRNIFSEALTPTGGRFSGGDYEDFFLKIDYFYLSECPVSFTVFF